MKLLLIGSGGREHALADAFVRHGHQVYALPGNPGMEPICESIPEDWLNLNAKDFSSLANFASGMGIDLTVVGPERPLAEGIADTFEARGLSLFGPNHQAAIFETGKIWVKEFLLKNDIPTARFVIGRNIREARDAIATHFNRWRGVVVKPVGLAGGRGITVCHTREEAEAAIKLILEDKIYGISVEAVVIEELLEGREITLPAFCDGNKILPMIPSQDYTGACIGGIGSYAGVSLLEEEIVELIEKKIIKRTQHGLKNEPFVYRGMLDFRLILTDEGPKVIDYHCCFGDPEAQAVIPLLKTDLAEVMLACCNGALDRLDLEWSDQASCCVMMISNGYPGICEVGYEIFGLQDLKECSQTMVFHGCTRKNESGRIVTSGGRVLGITGFGDSLDEAIEMAYYGIETVHFHNASYHHHMRFHPVKKFVSLAGA